MTGRIGSADPATHASHGAATASPPYGECPLREGFTPGPWEARPREDGNLHVRIRGTQFGKKFKIANALMAYDDGHEEQEAQANANLIAAAPELFEACRLFAEEYDAATDDEGVAMMLAYDAALKTAKRALAKARGESA